MSGYQGGGQTTGASLRFSDMPADRRHVESLFLLPRGRFFDKLVEDVITLACREPDWCKQTVDLTSPGDAAEHDGQVASIAFPRAFLNLSAHRSVAGGRHCRGDCLLL